MDLRLKPEPGQGMMQRILEFIQKQILCEELSYTMNKYNNTTYIYQLYINKRLILYIRIYNKHTKKYKVHIHLHNMQHAELSLMQVQCKAKERNENKDGPVCRKRYIV